MAKQYVDVWKYPHMTYKKAFVIATIISIITVGVAFISFSDYIESQMTGSLQINLITEEPVMEDKMETLLFLQKVM